MLKKIRHLRDRKWKSCEATEVAAEQKKKQRKDTGGRVAAGGPDFQTDCKYCRLTCSQIYNLQTSQRHHILLWNMFSVRALDQNFDIALVSKFEAKN